MTGGKTLSIPRPVEYPGERTVRGGEERYFVRGSRGGTTQNGQSDSFAVTGPITRGPGPAPFDPSRAEPSAGGKG
jgi:hypothetical protein